MLERGDRDELAQRRCALDERAAAFVGAGEEAQRRRRGAAVGAAQRPQLDGGVDELAEVARIAERREHHLRAGEPEVAGEREAERGDLRVGGRLDRAEHAARDRVPGRPPQRTRRIGVERVAGGHPAREALVGACEQLRDRDQWIRPQLGVVGDQRRRGAGPLRGAGQVERRRLHLAVAVREEHRIGAPPHEPPLRRLARPGRVPLAHSTGQCIINECRPW